MVDSIIGIIPAAGTASRIHGLPKYLLPCPDGYLLSALSRRMYTAGASKVWIGASKATEPFIKPYTSGETVSIVVGSQNMPQTVLAGRKAADDSTVLMGMPDSYWQFPYVYEKLMHRITEFGATVAVGLWRIRNDQRGKLGQVDTYGDRCTQIIDKNPDCLLPYAWGALAWTPSFWDFIQPDMPHMGVAMQAAIDANVKVWPVFMDGEYHDCGEWASYALMCSRFVEEGTYVR
jgi:CTP:molybdopterin cytidylyltransferase MocA